MCKIMYLLGLFSISFHLVASWDIAVTQGNKIEFYANGTKISSEGLNFHKLTAMTYDAVYNILVFVDKTNQDSSIYMYYLNNSTFSEPIATGLKGDIDGIAFDPVTKTIFWTDTAEKNVFSMSLTDNVPKRLHNETSDETPRAIAVDSCRGYVYWTTVVIPRSGTIKRAKIDGSNIKTLIGTGLYLPVGLAVDQKTASLYWDDDKEGVHFSIESSDLDGKNKRILAKSTHFYPEALTISKNYIYWFDKGYKNLIRQPKNETIDNDNFENLKYINFTEQISRVVANYNLVDQYADNEMCKHLLTMNRKPDLPVPVRTNEEVSQEKTICQNPVDTTITLCYNFCLYGNCTLKSGRPQCRCKKGYKGSRCELNELDLCKNYCLNNGSCMFSPNMAPNCICSQDYEGERCEILRTNENKTKMTAVVPELSEINVKENLLETCSSAGWDQLRDPILLTLAVICILLCVACAVLINKIMKLKKLPRIKRRIIVNKNVTPLTARPDQCEITIENCCNMNICETPCFEPRTTIKPNLLDSKPGKEEKKNLIDNMEHPDDLLF